MYRNSLVVAYIKELLHNFNLPRFPVLTESTKPYRKRTYIKEHKVGSYGYNKFEPLYDFVRNHKMVNVTKNLIINSSEYDEYTHNYLGEYLRFLRDYDGIDLMGMYNCFFKQQPRRLKKKFMASPHVGLYYEMDVDTNDINYNYYLVPVKFNKGYTISVTSPCTYELALVIHDNQFLYKDKPFERRSGETWELSQALFGYTYMRARHTNAKDPFVYDTHVENRNGFNDGDLAEYLWPMEEKLRLLIKIPASVKSAITILEGDWVNNSSYTCGVYTDTYKFDDNTKNFISRSSLIRANDNIQRPFSDRLIEYLFFNAIDSNEFIDENIKRVQDNLYDTPKGMHGVWSDELRRDLYNELFSRNRMLGDNSSSLNTDVYSVETGARVVIHKRLIDSYSDMIGFVDKDLERHLELRGLSYGQ